MKSNCKLLEGKTAIITGANRGIGKAILELFAQHGAVVYAIARQENSLTSIIEELNKLYNNTVFPVYFDVTNIDFIKNLILRIKKEQGHLDCLVNNAGIMKDALIGMISQEDIESTFNVNVFSNINFIQYATKLMKKQNSGSIINITSVVASKGSVGQLVYSSSKGAVISLTKSASKELSPYKIRVNAIAPGMIETDLIKTLSEETIAKSIKNIPLGRLGTVYEIANSALFLASDMSEYITGQIIGVDGAIIM